MGNGGVRGIRVSNVSLSRPSRLGPATCDAHLDLLADSFRLNLVIQIRHLNELRSPKPGLHVRTGFSPASRWMVTIAASIRPPSDCSRRSVGVRDVLCELCLGTGTLQQFNEAGHSAE